MKELLDSVCIIALACGLAFLARAIRSQADATATLAESLRKHRLYEHLPTETE